jgi:hypothetical protein
MPSLLMYEGLLPTTAILTLRQQVVLSLVEAYPIFGIADTVWTWRNKA